MIGYDGTVTFQSRNRIITPEKDNHACAGILMQKRMQILELRERFVGRWEEINGGSVGRDGVVICKFDIPLLLVYSERFVCLEPAWDLGWVESLGDFELLFWLPVPCFDSDTSSKSTFLPKHELF